MISGDLIDGLQRLSIALAIGFLVGVERGWKQRDEAEGERVAGLRTFALCGLLGGVSGLCLPAAGPLFLAAGTLAFAAAFVAFQLRHADDNSATSTIAGLLVYSLGVYSAFGDLGLAAAAAVAVTSILAFKQTLHQWLAALTWKEIRSALLILAATFIALPVLPDRAIDPWGVLNPRSLWLLTVILASVSFGGYIALRTLGPRSGLLVGAMVGAVVSSTAVTLELARGAARRETAARVAAAAASLAMAVSLLRIGAIGSALAPDMALLIWAPLGCAIVTCLVSAGVLARRSAPAAEGAGRPLRSPLDVPGVLRFAALLAGLIAIAEAVRFWMGEAGLNVFAATAGLFDVDAVTLALAGMQGLPTLAAVQAILIATGANTLFKAALGLGLGGRAFGGWFALACIAGLGAGAVCFWMMTHVFVPPSALP